MPLGKLSDNAIKQGYEILKKIADELAKKKPNRDKLIDFSSQFYTHIPYINIIIDMILGFQK